MMTSTNTSSAEVGELLRFPVHISNDLVQDMKVIVIYPEIQVNASIFRQVNDFCFDYDIFKKTCSEVMSFASARLGHNVLHISLRQKGINDLNPVTAYVTNVMHNIDRYMEMLFPEHNSLVRAVEVILQSPKVVYNIGSSSVGITYNLAHLCTFLEKKWPQTRIINFDFLAENRFLFDSRVYYPIALGNMSGEVRGRWFHGDLSALGDHLFRTMSIDKSDDFFDSSIHRLDDFVGDRNLPLPDVIFFDKSDVSVLLGASRCMSKVRIFSINLPHTRKDFYNILAGEALSLISSEFPDFVYIGLLNYRGPDDEMCAMFSDCTADYVFQRINRP